MTTIVNSPKRKWSKLNKRKLSRIYIEYFTAGGNKHFMQMILIIWIFCTSFCWTNTIRWNWLEMTGKAYNFTKAKSDVSSVDFILNRWERQRWMFFLSTNHFVKYESFVLNTFCRKIVKFLSELWNSSYTLVERNASYVVCL